MARELVVDEATALPLVCYGVEARSALDSSTPEYVISDDPQDPKCAGWVVNFVFI